MNTVLRKLVMGFLVASLALAGLPLGSAYAAGPGDPPTPQTTPQAQRVDFRLRRAFARETKILNRAGKLYKQLDLGFPKIQNRIDRAKARGLDVTQAQAAFDAFKKALTDARPLYNQAQSITDARKGFDANGKVTDPVAARETVKSLRETEKQFKDAMGGTLKALRQAIKTLRESRQTPTPTPAS